MILKFYLFAFLIQFSIVQMTGQEDSVNFETILSKKTLGLNENLRVDFKMNKDGDNFNPPDFKGFRVIGDLINPLVICGSTAKELFLKVIHIF